MTMTHAVEGTKTVVAIQYKESWKNSGELEEIVTSIAFNIRSVERSSRDKNKIPDESKRWSLQYQRIFSNVHHILSSLLTSELPIDFESNIEVDQ
ncbi:hypothetical protein Prudu_005794 [Prunus dulcis]|uniref:Uncharacterized protein n=1 Tax=Prunus dulcis TaxID=3755 RepID=A0A4Y1QYE6_PRUDU|nr:hypothetical protein Prudu_005794 [Prunus dulcis]